jgi:hypothetical protein
MAAQEIGGVATEKQSFPAILAFVARTEAI